MLQPCPCFQHQGSCLLPPPPRHCYDWSNCAHRSCTHPCVTATPAQRPCVDQLVSHARRSRNYTTEMGRGVPPSSVIGAGNCVCFLTRAYEWQGVTLSWHTHTHTLPGYKRPISCENTCNRGRALHAAAQQLLAWKNKQLRSAGADSSALATGRRPLSPNKCDQVSDVSLPAHYVTMSLCDLCVSHRAMTRCS